MNSVYYKLLNLYLIMIICLVACNNRSASQSVNKQTKGDIVNLKDSSAVHLTALYTQAIDNFIQAVNIKDKISFDTLFFGKHVYGQADDFPDISLPSKIENTQIKLIDPTVGQQMQKERLAMVYINMMAWIEKDNAEFLMVVFSNGGIHQYDYTLTYFVDPTSHQSTLTEIAFENYLALNGQKPKRQLLYSHGSYLIK